VSYREPVLPAVSSVSGRVVEAGEWTSAAYWAEQIRRPVRFHDALAALTTSQGATRLLEIGPDPVLTAQAPTDTAVAVSVLRRDRAETDALLTALAEVFVRGTDVDWAAVFDGTGARRVDLPTYAFRRRRYWLPDHAGDNSVPDLLGTARENDVPDAAHAPGDRLRALPAAGREQAVVEVIVSQAAHVLGHADLTEVGVTQRFMELGFTSLSLADLRNRINRACGLDLPTGALYDHATPHALAAHVNALLALREGSDTREGPHAADPVTALVRYAFERHLYDKGLDLLDLAAATRPDDERPARRPVRLATGTQGDTLLCLPSLVAPSTPYQYARFAAALEGVRDVWVLPTPGYAPGEPLPDRPEAAAARLARTVLDAFGDKPPALVAYSSGGWLAHLLDAALSEAGAPPSALVLLDSPAPAEQDLALAMVGTSCRLMEEFPEVPVDVDQLTATAHYGRLFTGWRPTGEEASGRTLFVAAAEHDPALLMGADRPSWPLPHEAVEVPGNHATLLDGDAETTARTVHTWLLDR
ncbi:thioesterase domain-containing protein, partial [Streptomyces sp. NPDC002519]